MGCGSSSLKGDKVDDIKPTDQPQPIKKVKTNFSEVDFTGESGHRRGTVAVAPHETRRPTRVSETAEGETIQSTSDPIPEEAPKQTYEPIPGDTDLASPTTDKPVVNLPESDPTSSAAKDDFASTNAPHNKSATEPSNNLIVTDDKPRRKSWLARFSDARKDKSMDITDEELKKQTGMNRAEFEEWKNDPKNKVGKHQNANDGTHGMDPGAAVA